MNAIRAELLKLRGATVVWATFVAFALAPLMGAVFMWIMGDPEALGRASALGTKAEVMGITADRGAYFLILSQAMGIGGIMVFGFVASWIFGREYSDGTAKDLLALPTGRARIIHAKFIVYALWCLAIALCNLLIGLVISQLMDLPAGSGTLVRYVQHYLITTALTIALGTPIAFFAIRGKGYLAPLGVIGLTLVFAQVVAAAGFGTYFPWSMPGLYSGAGGGHDLAVNAWSFVVLGLTSVLGYAATVRYWRVADQG
ncbi:MAG TPA: ABC transporter permease [Flavobacteriales bacterium]|nr:ABC transporter permease [Flavobacteriales bacterium]HMR27281.1 ABC transporter permease [Flavobacteriales bacterium]